MGGRVGRVVGVVREGLNSGGRDWRGHADCTALLTQLLEFASDVCSQICSCKLHRQFNCHPERGVAISA